jgi:hypothetical protein
MYTVQYTKVIQPDARIHNGWNRILEAKHDDYSEHITDESVIAHVIPRLVPLHVKFNFSISTTTAIVHNWCYLHYNAEPA